MLKILSDVLRDLWISFMGKPRKYLSDFSLEDMIRFECTHFFFSAFTGFLVAWLLMLTISSHNRWKWHDRYIYLFSFWWGLFACISVHLILDGFTTLA